MVLLHTVSFKRHINAKIFMIFQTLVTSLLCSFPIKLLESDIVFPIFNQKHLLRVCCAHFQSNCLKVIWYFQHSTEKYFVSAYDNVEIM